jgi:hypothetical protein
LPSRHRAYAMVRCLVDLGPASRRSCHHRSGRHRLGSGNASHRQEQVASSRRATIAADHGPVHRNLSSSGATSDDKQASLRSPCRPGRCPDRSRGATQDCARGLSAQRTTPYEGAHIAPHAGR